MGSKEAVAHLRKHKLVEGRANSLYLAAPLAKSDDEKAEYIKNKGFDNKYYQDLIMDYINKFSHILSFPKSSTGFLWSVH